MGLRFRKSKKIAPGIKLNVGKKSVGVSVGGKYGGVSFNSKSGTTTRVSAPGTGVSYTHTSSGGKKKSQSSKNSNVDNSSGKSLTENLDDFNKNNEPKFDDKYIYIGTHKHSAQSYHIAYLLVYIIFIPMLIIGISLLADGSIGTGIIFLLLTLFMFSIASNYRSLYKQFKAYNSGNSTVQKKEDKKTIKKWIVIGFIVIILFALIPHGSKDANVATNTETESQDTEQKDTTVAEQPANTQTSENEQASSDTAIIANEESTSDNSNVTSDNSNVTSDDTNIASDPTPTDDNNVISDPASTDNSNVSTYSESNDVAPANDTVQQDMVWVDDTAAKYHRKSNCSGMDNAYQVTREQAESMGKEACKKCFR